MRVDTFRFARSCVPILTQSENWALYYTMANLHSATAVPILTQSENWALYRYDDYPQAHEIVPILTQSENWALSETCRRPL